MANAFSANVSSKLPTFTKLRQLSFCDFNCACRIHSIFICQNPPPVKAISTDKIKKYTFDFGIPLQTGKLLFEILKISNISTQCLTPAPNLSARCSKSLRHGRGKAQKALHLRSAHNRTADNSRRTCEYRLFHRLIPFAPPC